MRVLILGADGYLGWPTCMFFSQRNHDVMGIDNYSRRQACRKLDCESLIPNPDLEQRVQIWEQVSGKKINYCIGDVTDYPFLLKIFREFQPEVVIHYAEQPSAPYSMINQETAAGTLVNNLISTLNVVYAVKEADLPCCHIIKLGTMGEYGTPNIDIEEGWLDIEHKGRKDRFLFPRQASSLYHTTKIQDTDLLWFYVRIWGLRVTDLMQGPVYGISTQDCQVDKALRPNFNYDEIFGTVVNRFIVQAVAGYPLTIYGQGNQKRGFLNIEDTLQCVYFSAMKPANPGELRVFNQITEVFSVKELAEKVQLLGNKLGYHVKLEHLKNPRVEKEDHYYNPTFTGLLELGLKPHFLSDAVIEGMFNEVDELREFIRKDIIFRGISWR
jgi:UDP-sulfoquinovose synthase